MAKNKKAPVTKRALVQTVVRGKAPAKGITKKERVRALLISKEATTVAALAEALAISNVAAYSLIGDLKRDGVGVKGKLADGVMHYTVATQPKPKKAEFGKQAEGATS